MDFKRIEMIFLAVFIALDVFLFVTLKQSRQPIELSGNQTQTTSLASELRSDGISIKHTLAKTHQQGYYLASSNRPALAAQVRELENQHVTLSNNNTTLTSRLVEPLNFKSGQATTAIDKFRQDKHNVAFGKDYQYVPELSTSTEIVYAQKVPNGVLLDGDGQITFQKHKNMITGYIQTYSATITTLREKENTISAKEAVNTLYTHNEIPNNTIIQGMKLGYTKLMDVKGSTVYIPAWYVSLESKASKNVTNKRVNAFSGEIMKNHD
ncbi:yycH family protein [Lactobacillus selangorensis]|uniref:YycH family protein n=1 Tax=Lactobacillus selangorensis TaxID=81857 RepID=A0A0R2FJ31_9LACO|nr:two-component system regulatory protein YycI [Lactobacillus selangorensis]KRN28665.1 yycH family protein [Lactobacillus selangorensis]KRN32925.1 yycH family protein [Lactobacillus selangorensis]